jgi:hypothetical protein
MQSGSNSFIKKFLLNRALSVDEFQGLQVNYNFVTDPGEIQDTPSYGFLYQAGYLTIQSKTGTTFTLGYPNYEVRSAISKLFLENLNNSYTNISKIGEELSEYLSIGDIPSIVDLFYQFLSGVYYGDHSYANREPQSTNFQSDIRNAVLIDLPEDSIRKLSEALTAILLQKQGEYFYRSIFQAWLWMSGAKVIPEKLENLGRLDLEVSYGNQTFVLELKMADDIIDGHTAARAGMTQILETGYGEASENSILISLAIGRKERNIVSCLYRKNGQEMCVFTKGHWKFLSLHKQRTSKESQ